MDQDRRRASGQKYENVLSQRMDEGLPYYPYVPPGVAELRKDTASPIFLTEGEKKALKMTQEGWPTLGLPGVFLFTDPGSSKRPADKPLHPELRRWRLRGRRVYVCFDSDRRTKDSVALALERLCAALTRLGARVFVVEVPLLDGHDKTGADDFLVARGPAPFGRLVAEARPWVPHAWLAELVPAELPREALATALEPARRRLRGLDAGELRAVAEALARRAGGGGGGGGGGGLSVDEALALLPVDTEPDPAPGSQRAQVVVGGRQLLAVVGDAWEAVLGSQLGRLLFRHGDGLVLAPGVEAEPGERCALRPVELPLMAALLTRSADWVRLGSEGAVKPVRVPPELARDMLVLPDERVPPLLAVSRLPLLRPGSEGAVRAEGGYERTLQLLHIAEPGVRRALVALPERPGPVQCQQALDWLQVELLGDFPFARPSDRAHALAALLLPFVRHLIKGPTPLHLIEAPTEGTGKGLLAEVLHLVATGASARPTPLPVHEDELRKKLTSELLGGPTLVLLDNVSQRLDSASLAAVLTASTWSDRLLGASKMVTLPNRAIWMATGNNPSLSRELARRTVRVRLNADSERPWLREGFRHPKLAAWTAGHRGELVVAALTLLRAWAQAGAPRGAVGLGSFEEWAAVLGGVLAHHGVEGFLEDRHGEPSTDDPEQEEWEGLVVAWLEHFGEEPVSARELQALATELGLFELGGAAAGERGARARFSRALSRRRGRRYGVWRLKVSRDAHRKVNLYRLEAAEGTAACPAMAGHGQRAGGGRVA